MHRITTRAAIMLLIATFATGCDASQGNLAESFTRTGEPAIAATTVVAEDGEHGQSASTATHAGSGELPDSWPSDIALPPGSSIGATTAIESGDATLMTASGSVGLPAFAVRDHFDEQFAGWKADEQQWRNGTSTWNRMERRARVVVGEQAGQTGFMVRLD